MKYLVWIAVAIIILFIGYMIYSGIFTDVTVSESEQGPYKLVYGEHIGDYSKTAGLQMEIYGYLLKELNITTTRGFGIYYDNPKDVQKEKLRSDVGCILDTTENVDLKKIQEKYKVKDFIKTKSITSDFPFKSRASILIGILKVYPKMMKYINEKNLKTGYSMEIYDIPNKKITYIFPILEP